MAQRYFRHITTDSLVTMISSHRTKVENLIKTDYDFDVYSMATGHTGNFRWTIPFTFTGVVRVKFKWKPNTATLGIGGASSTPYIAIRNPVINRDPTTQHIGWDTTTQRALMIRLSGIPNATTFPSCRLNIGMVNGSNIVYNTTNLPVDITPTEFTDCEWILDTNTLTHTFTTTSSTGIITTHSQEFTEIGVNISIGSNCVFELAVPLYYTTLPSNPFHEQFSIQEISVDNVPFDLNTLFGIQTIGTNTIRNGGTAANNYIEESPAMGEYEQKFIKNIPLNRYIPLGNISVVDDIITSHIVTDNISIPHPRTYTLRDKPSNVILPNFITNLTGWYDASDLDLMVRSGDRVSVLYDKSANSRNAVQTSAAAQPYLISNGLNGRSVLRFLGNSNHMLLQGTGAFDLTFRGSSFFAVVSKESGTSNIIFMSHNNVQTALFHYGTGVYVGSLMGTYEFNSNQYYIIYVRTNVNRSVDVFINGSFAFTNTIHSANEPSTTSLGYPQYNTGNHRIAEIIAFNNNMTDTNQRIIEGYLAHKWGLIEHLPENHPYKSITP